MADDFISGALAGQQFQLNNFLIQEAPIKLEQEKMALVVSKADFNRRQKMADLLAAKPPPAGQNPMENAANALIAMGSAAAQVGMVEEAASSFSKASTIQQQQEDAAYKNWEMTFQRTKFATDILANVHSPQDWKQANEYIQMMTGQPSAMADKEYSPELVRTLQEAAIKKRDAAQQALDKARTNRENSLAALDKESVELKKAQIELTKARAENAAKVGGQGNGVTPKRANVSDVAARLVKESNDEMSMTDARAFAPDIALDLERRMREDGLTQPQALKAAVDWAKAHGALAGVQPAKVRPGTSIKKPLPLPTDPSQLKPNMIYQTSAGPRWYDEETRSFYEIGKGPEGEEKDDE